MALVSAGKHYINTQEISYIQFVTEYTSSLEPYEYYVYEFAMKNSGFIRVTEEEFKDFKENCGRRYNVL